MIVVLLRHLRNYDHTKVRYYHNGDYTNHILIHILSFWHFHIFIKNSLIDEFIFPKYDYEFIVNIIQ